MIFGSLAGVGAATRFAAMAEITRFSLLFDPAEDRLALDMLDDAGTVTRLWLTQRLCRGLTPVLAPLVAGDAEDAPRQSWAQAAAVEAMAATPPVRVGGEVTVGLVHEVSVTPTAGRIGLVLRFSGGQRELGLSPVALRQTLAELYRLHAAAGWPLDQWPAWVANPAGEAAAAGGVQ